jgi:hypothetical protein
VPAEAARLQRRIGDRDRRFFATLALLAAAGTIVAVLLFGYSRGAAGGATTCVAFDQPGVMGGGTWHYCGDRAAAFCRTHASESAQLTATCARLDP